jgi:uncharacterized protein HemX
VFNDTNNEENETSFTEAYRSQILNGDNNTEDKSSKNLIIILLLVIIVVALGIFGYNYLSQDNHTEDTKIAKESIKEEPIKEEEVIEPPESTMLNNINELLEEDESNNTEEETANTIKLEAEKKSLKKEKKIDKQKAEDTYLEQLAELSKEIDGEK